MRGIGARNQRAWIPGLMVLGLLLVIYCGTLQRDINGSGHDYAIDVGEIQVSLNIWGTIHYTGYPLFNILGALFTQALRILGLSPAAAASAVATVWSILGLAAAHLLTLRVTENDRALAALTVLALGVVEAFWIHSIVAEVYSFSMLLTSVILLLAMDLNLRWDERRWWLTILLLGIGAQHHRILILLIPCVLILAAPTLRQIHRNWLVFGAKSVFIFALPFLAYLYIPLRAIQGSRWVYGRPDTWHGFWTVFTGRGVTENLTKWPADLAAWRENLSFIVRHLQRQLPAVVLLAGAAGLLWLTWRRSMWTGLALLTGAVAFVGFLAAFPSAVWAPAVLMPTLLFLMVGLAFLFHRLMQIVSLLRWGARASLILLAVWLFRTNLPFVHGLANNPAGREVIQMLQPLRGADLPGGRNVVALPWGGTHFAAAYGLYVTDELEGFQLVSHDRDFRSIVEREGKILTLAYNLGNWPLDFWIELLGEAHYSSAAPGVAMISQRVLYEDIAPRIGFDLGNGIRVRAADLFWETEGKLQLALYWEATQVPRSDFRVAVHLVAKDPPQSPQDLLAQADAFNPVGGWYPVNLWDVGEVVRDDYALSVPRGSRPVAVRVGMYQMDESGAFVNTEWLSLPIPERGSF